MAKNTDRTGECSECHGLRHQKGCSQHFSKKKMAESPKVAAKRKAITRRHPRKPKKAKRQNTSAEVAALRTVIEAFELLAVEGQTRVVRCVVEWFGIELAA